MAGDLFHWNKVELGIYVIENAEVRYGWGFISLEKPKQGTMKDLFYWKGLTKVRLGIYFIEKAKIRYDSGFILLKRSK